MTEMVGKSTCGSGATGSTTNASAPASATATVSSVVATGRRMNGAEMFMPASGALRLGSPQAAGCFGLRAEPPAEVIEEDVDDGVV